MTMPTQAQAEKHAAKLLTVARRMVAEPNDFDVRRDYMRACFNHDWTAAAIIAIAEGRTFQEPQT
jgi:hypothetical protein